MLKRRGVETRLVRYQTGDHGFGGAYPRYTCDVLNRTLDWFDKHLRGNAGPTRRRPRN